MIQDLSLYKLEFLASYYNVLHNIKQEMQSSEKTDVTYLEYEKEIDGFMHELLCEILRKMFSKNNV